MPQSSSRFPYGSLSLVLLASLGGILAIVLIIRASTNLLVETRERTYEVESLYGRILLFDEVLTMSARYAVALALADAADDSLEPKKTIRTNQFWAERYYRTEQQLDESLATLDHLLTDKPGLRSHAQQTSTANAELVNIEHQALESRGVPALRRAREALEGERYRTLKEDYSAGMQSLIDTTRDRFGADVSRQRGLASAAWLMCILISIGLIATWYVAVRRIGHWHSTILELRAESEEARLSIKDSIEAAQLGTFVMDASGGVELSARAMALLGTDQSSGSVANVFGNVEDKDRTKLLAFLNKSVEAPLSTAQSMTIKVLDPQRWLSLHWRPHSDPRQSQIRGLLRDVTEEYLITDRLVRDNAELADKFERTQMLADARLEDNESLLRALLQSEQQERERLSAHLHGSAQQILVAARMRTSLLDARDELDEDAKSHVAALTELLDEATASLRDLSTRLQTPRLAEGGLPAALEWLRDNAQALHGVIIDLRVASDLPALRSEAELLVYEVVHELLLNIAKHANAQRASVSVELGEGDELRVVVEDDGDGFEPETTLRPQSGLTQFTQRVNSIDGELRIESSPGNGARISLRVSDVAERSQQARIDADEVGPRRTRVLLADDNKPLRDQLAMLLSRDGRFEIVAEAASGPEAVRMAKRARPDVIIMDYSMPGFDGAEATRRIKQSNPDIRVVGFSVLHEANARQRLEQAGVDTILAKDGRLSDLVDQLSFGSHGDGARSDQEA